MRIADVPAIENMSVSEKILLVEDLWDSIAADETALPVLASHRAELDRRLASHRANPGALLTLAELRFQVYKWTGQRNHDLITR